MVPAASAGLPLTNTAAAQAVARQLGPGCETVRRWVVSAEIDAGRAAGATLVELAEIKTLKRRSAGARKAMPFCARPRSSSPGNSTPGTADHGVYRRHSQRGPCSRVDLSGAARAGMPGRRADLPGLGSRAALRRLTPSPTRPLPMSSTPPPAGSTGQTTADSTAPSE
jgi:hypothetical protein